MSNSTSSPGYFRIKINSLTAGQTLDFNLYVTVGERYVMYLNSGQVLTDEKLNKVKDRNAYFYISDEQKMAYKKYVSEQIRNDQLTISAKASILRESSYSLVAELYENPDVDKALEGAKEVVANFIEFMENEPEGMAELISLSGHDFYTYNHSLDVGIYSLGLGKVIGYGKDEIEELGRAALYHDVGKRHVSPDIICKDGPLDEVEWAQMQKHPLFGLKILNDHATRSNDITEGIKAAAFEHHENFLGTGYPQQLLGHEIHPYARIIAITDTFDAMTTQRSYNTPKTPTEAIEFMNAKLSDRYDPDMLKAFSSVLFSS